ncbi:hypothetical protein KIPB_005075, partial [Kipferlia bialata]
SIHAEISSLTELASDQVVKYYRSHLCGTHLSLVMEFMRGSVLDLMEATPIPEPEVGYILREALQGLEYLHSHGNIHRDIKAANILLSEAGMVKLADFGVCGTISATMSKRQTFVGTPFWMAPEVIKTNVGYDTTADIWSLGITAIEMITGTPPHSEMHPLKALMMIPKAPAPTLPVSNPASKALRDFIAQCLTKNPDDRPNASRLLQHKFIRTASRSPARLAQLVSRISVQHPQPEPRQDGAAPSPPPPVVDAWDFSSDDDSQPAPAPIRRRGGRDRSHPAGVQSSPKVPQTARAEGLGYGMASDSEDSGVGAYPGDSVVSRGARDYDYGTVRRGEEQEYDTQGPDSGMHMREEGTVKRERERPRQHRETERERERAKEKEREKRREREREDERLRERKREREREPEREKKRERERIAERKREKERERERERETERELERELDMEREAERARLQSMGAHGDTGSVRRMSVSSQRGGVDPFAVDHSEGEREGSSEDPDGHGVPSESMEGLFVLKDRRQSQYQDTSDTVTQSVAQDRHRHRHLDQDGVGAEGSVRSRRTHRSSSHSSHTTKRRRRRRDRDRDRDREGEDSEASESYMQESDREREGLGRVEAGQGEQGEESDLESTGGRRRGRKRERRPKEGESSTSALETVEETSKHPAPRPVPGEREAASVAPVPAPAVASVSVAEGTGTAPVVAGEKKEKTPTLTRRQSQRRESHHTPQKHQKREREKREREKKERAQTGLRFRQEVLGPVLMAGDSDGLWDGSGLSDAVSAADAMCQMVAPSLGVALFRALFAQVRTHHPAIAQSQLGIEPLAHSTEWLASDRGRKGEGAPGPLVSVSALAPDSEGGTVPEEVWQAIQAFRR